MTKYTTFESCFSVGFIILESVHTLGLCVSNIKNKIEMLKSCIIYLINSIIKFKVPDVLNCLFKKIMN